MCGRGGPRSARAREGPRCCRAGDRHAVVNTQEEESWLMKRRSPSNDAHGAGDRDNTRLRCSAPPGLQRHERNAPSAPHSSSHRRRARGLVSDHYSLHRHRHGAARNRRLPDVRPADGRRALPACVGLSHRLRRRGLLHRGAARARSAHAARAGAWRRGPCLEHCGRRGDVGRRARLVFPRSHRHRDAVRLGSDWRRTGPE